MTFRLTLLATSVMAATAVWAEPSATMLDQITVTATRSEKQLKDVSGSISVKDSEQIEKEMARNIKDLMRYEPGVEVGTSARTGIEGFNIRGMEANRVKIMIDGVDQSQQFDTGTGYGYISSQRNFVDIDALKAVEVVKGPSSSLYGSDAIGGTVAYITKDPSDYLKAEGDDSHASLKTAYTSVDEGFSETITLANRSGDLDTMLVYTRRDAKETENYGGANVYGANRGETDPMDSSSNNILAKAQYQINDVHRAGVTLEVLDSEYDIDLMSNDATGASGEDESNRTRFGVFHEWQANSVLADKIKWTLDWQETEQKQLTHMPAYGADYGLPFLIPMEERLKDYEYTEDTITLNAQFDKALTFAGKEHNIIYGFNVSQTDTENNNTTTTVKTGNVENENYIPKVEAKKYGIFLQDEIQVTNRLTVTPGLRYDSYEYNPEGNASFNDNEVTDIDDSKVTARLGAVYALTDNLNAFAQFSQGFKAPGFYEMYFTRDGGSYLSEANPDLKPEESDSFELGLRGEGGLGSYEITAFYNKYDNFIESVTDYSSTEYYNGVTTYQNIAEAEIKGLEMRGELWLDEAMNAPLGTSLRASLAYADGEDTENDTPLNSVAPLKAVIGVAYDDPSDMWGGELIWTLVKGKSDSDIDESAAGANVEHFSPGGYGLVDMTTYYKPHEKLTLRAGLFNITDKKYYIWDDVRGMEEGENGIDRYSQPGRNVSVSMNYVF